MTRVEQEIPDQPDTTRLFGNTAGPDAETLLAEDVRFFVARRDGTAIGCAGYVPAGPGLAAWRRVVAPDPETESLLRAAALDLARREGLSLPADPPRPAP